MSSTFTNIPPEEIHKFIRDHHLEFSDDQEENYLTVWNYILDHPGLSISSVYLADFITAYNLQSEIDQRYPISSIVLAPEEELGQLSRLLGFHHIDKERILRILGYLGLLDDDTSRFEQLPKDILGFIAMKLDCQSLGLFCQISQKFNRSFCLTGELTEMFRLKLKETTRLDISKYTKEELSLLCKRNYNKTKISASGDHSLVLVGYSTAISPPDPSELNSQGRVFGFGSAKSGQLGTIGKITHETNPILVDTYHIEGTITSVVASWGYSMILNDLGQVFSFGTNDYGQLGSGNYDERKYPSIVSALDDEKIIAVSAGDDHCLLLNDRGQVFVLGSNEFGQLGLKPEEVEREGFEIDENITIPILLDTTGIGEIIAVSAGSSYSMILNSQGQVFSFGTNDVGQLGLGNTHDQITPTMIDHIKIGKVVAISAGDHHSLILNSQGQVFSFGANTYGQLGLGDIKDRTIPTLINTSEMGRIVAVSASNFSLILNSQDQVFGFGDNEYGQLGLDDQIPRMVPTLIDIPEIIAISAGGFHSLFLNSQGQIFSCGNNIHGQLGQGNTNNLLRPTLIRGIIF